MVLCFPKLNFVVLVGKTFLTIKAEAINSHGLMLDPKWTDVLSRSSTHIELLWYTEEKAGQTTCFAYHLHSPTPPADLFSQSKWRTNKLKQGRENTA